MSDSQTNHCFELVIFGEPVDPVHRIRLSCLKQFKSWREHRSTSWPDSHSASNQNTAVSDLTMNKFSAPAPPTVTELRKQFWLGPKTDEPLICICVKMKGDMVFILWSLICFFGSQGSGSRWLAFYESPKTTVSAKNLLYFLLKKKVTYILDGLTANFHFGVN